MDVGVLASGPRELALSRGLVDSGHRVFIFSLPWCGALGNRAVTTGPVQGNGRGGEVNPASPACLGQVEHIFIFPETLQSIPGDLTLDQRLIRLCMWLVPNLYRNVEVIFWFALGDKEIAVFQDKLTEILLFRDLIVDVSIRVYAQEPLPDYPSLSLVTPSLPLAACLRMNRP